MKHTAEQKKAALEARRRYQKAWRQKNPGKNKDYQDRYWLRKGAEMAHSGGEADDEKNK